MQFLIISMIITKALSITFQINHINDTCIYIKQPGLHQFEFLVSGSSPQMYICKIYSNQIMIKKVQIATDYQSVIEFQNQNNKMCFRSLDEETKWIQFDIISVEDPLINYFLVKEQKETHLKMYTAFQELSKVYRDQNMLLMRSQLYQIKMKSIQQKIIFVFVFKIIVGIILVAFQFTFIKELIKRKTYYSLPQGLQDDDSEEG